MKEFVREKMDSIAEIAIEISGSRITFF